LPQQAAVMAKGSGPVTKIKKNRAVMGLSQQSAQAGLASGMVSR
jgi:hypothetical protein